MTDCAVDDILASDTAPSAPDPLLDPACMAAIAPAAVRTTRPYPFVELDRVLTAAGYEALRAGLPQPEQFAPVFGRRRPHGQASHDRFVLQYRRGLPLTPAWRRLIAELNGPVYRGFVAGLLGHDRFLLHCHWHYTPAGCSVSPHCDAPWKLGSHIFYFNTEADWDPAWGGHTLILDDGGRHPPRSAPGFEDFTATVASGTIGNRSLVFLRRDHSWHGVLPLRCPEGALRKVFIVEYRDTALATRARTLLRI